MEKQVIVTIKSKQIVDNKEETLELVTPGKFYKKQDTYFVVYDETELSGMEGTTTTVKIQDSSVNLIRFGTTSSNMKFDRGIKDTSLYKTPYGVLELSVKTTAVNVGVDDNGGEVKLFYELSTGGQKMSKNELYIKIVQMNVNK